MEVSVVLSTTPKSISKAKKLEYSDNNEYDPMEIAIEKQEEEKKKEETTPAAAASDLGPWRGAGGQSQLSEKEAAARERETATRKTGIHLLGSPLRNVHVDDVVDPSQQQQQQHSLDENDGGMNDKFRRHYVVAGTPSYMQRAAIFNKKSKKEDVEEEELKSAQKRRGSGWLGRRITPEMMASLKIQGSIPPVVIRESHNNNNRSHLNWSLVNNTDNDNDDDDEDDENDEYDNSVAQILQGESPVQEKINNNNATTPTKVIPRPASAPAHSRDESNRFGRGSDDDDQGFLYSQNSFSTPKRPASAAPTSLRIGLQKMSPTPITLNPEKQQNDRHSKKKKKNKKKRRGGGGDGEGSGSSDDDDDEDIDEDDEDEEEEESDDDETVTTIDDDKDEAKNRNRNTSSSNSRGKVKHQSVGVSTATKFPKKKPNEFVLEKSRRTKKPPQKEPAVVNILGPVRRCTPGPAQFFYNKRAWDLCFRVEEQMLADLRLQSELELTDPPATPTMATAATTTMDSLEEFSQGEKIHPDRLKTRVGFSSDKFDDEDFAESYEPPTEQAAAPGTAAMVEEKTEEKPTHTVEVQMKTSAGASLLFSSTEAITAIATNMLLKVSGEDDDDEFIVKDDEDGEMAKTFDDGLVFVNRRGVNRNSATINNILNGVDGSGRISPKLSFASKIVLNSQSEFGSVDSDPRKRNSPTSASSNTAYRLFRRDDNEDDEDYQHRPVRRPTSAGLRERIQAATVAAAQQQQLQQLEVMMGGKPSTDLKRRILNSGMYVQVPENNFGVATTATAVDNGIALAPWSTAAAAATTAPILSPPPPASLTSPISNSNKRNNLLLQQRQKALRSKANRFGVEAVGLLEHSSSAQQLRPVSPQKKLLLSRSNSEVLMSNLLNPDGESLINNSRQSPTATSPDLDSTRVYSTLVRSKSLLSDADVVSAAAALQRERTDAQLSSPSPSRNDGSRSSPPFHLQLQQLKNSHRQSQQQMHSDGSLSPTTCEPPSPPTFSSSISFMDHSTSSAQFSSSAPIFDDAQNNNNSNNSNHFKNVSAAALLPPEGRWTSGNGFRGHDPIRESFESSESSKRSSSKPPPPPTPVSGGGGGGAGGNKDDWSVPNRNNNINNTTITKNNAKTVSIATTPTDVSRRMLRPRSAGGGGGGTKSAQTSMLNLATALSEEEKQHHPIHHQQQQHHQRRPHVVNLLSIVSAALEQEVIGGSKRTTRGRSPSLSNSNATSPPPEMIPIFNTAEGSSSRSPSPSSHNRHGSQRQQHIQQQQQILAFQRRSSDLSLQPPAATAGGAPSGSSNLLSVSAAATATAKPMSVHFSRASEGWKDRIQSSKQKKEETVPSNPPLENQNIGTSTAVAVATSIPPVAETAFLGILPHRPNYRTNNKNLIGSSSSSLFSNNNNIAVSTTTTRKLSSSSLPSRRSSEDINNNNNISKTRFSQQKTTGGFPSRPSSAPLVRNPSSSRFGWGTEGNDAERERAQVGRGYGTKQLDDELIKQAKKMLLGGKVVIGWLDQKNQRYR